MKRSSIITAIILTTIVVTFSGCSKAKNEASPKTSESVASTEKNFTFKLQHPGVEGDAYFKGALEFARLTKEYSGGSITIDVYPNGELASGSNAVQGVQMGTIDIAVESSMTEANFIPSLNVLNLPFLLSDYDQVWSVLDGDVGQELAKNAESAGFKVLSYWDNGFRNVSNGQRPINSVKDMVGLKIRVPENKVFVATWEALGAIPTPMAWSEVYSSLQLGTVDGQENPNGHMKSYNLTEVQKYFAITNHVYTAEPVIMNLSAFNKLSVKQQDALMKAAKESALYERELRAQINEDTLGWIKNQGTEITYPNLDEFQSAMVGVYQKYGATYSELLTKIQAITSK